MSRQPVVVIVGRPNVGKSTLFNRLTRSRRALVHDLPGVTRDRIMGEAEDRRGRPVVVIGTRGRKLGEEGGFQPRIPTHAETAIRDGDVVVLLLDGETGPVPEDRAIGDYLRTLGLAVVPVVNKGDRGGVELAAQEFFQLGFGEPVVVSAEHGTGIDHLWRALEPFLERPDEPADEPSTSREEVNVAIIGRPNVGKSSLLNRLVGMPRALVSEIPGTTRDAIDVVLERDDARYRFVDTAGIRRKGRTERGPEVLSVMMARRHLERADVCLLLVDATEAVTRQDGHVGGYAWEAGRAVALVVNKWDLVDSREEARRRIEDQIAQQLKFMHHAPTVFLSAKTGRGVQRLFPVMDALFRAHRLKVGTSDINRILHDAWDRRPPSGEGRREPKLYYSSQVRHAPPHFVLFTNLVRPPHFSYQRYLENALRASLGLDGVPIRVIIKGRKR